MINANELRIGNWVKCVKSNDAGYYKVLKIDGWMLRIELGGVRKGEELPERLLKPIELTPDLLIKIGFEEIYTSEEMVMCFIKDNVRVLFKNGGIECNCGYNYDWIPVLTIHQLQNITHALTNSELNIDL